MYPFEKRERKEESGEVRGGGGRGIKRTEEEQYHSVGSMHALSAVTWHA